ncbi:DUF4178 domain-containing protein [Pseudooceanicola sp. 216_PA32_1]|uniref:DUF4178 domain-containing protein n=1 Tax=Pseudooceanicola pacificus TaxID=2676438 RepID=A0A844W1K6_9RHOB|nr:DUF4178 domain-containing protein [Pseudooceanicola pacificus]MWB76681.1 DUF4178 domain-containing protein [Pseudooceanicola pacificus]
MTRAAEIRAINCTNCGAGLDVLGGGRVMSHVCGYCGSELDAQDNYRVLRRYADLVRPDSPLAIGMTGTLDGVAFTVIGTLGMEESWHGEYWRWVEHQLYSPTHGYVWLSWEDGHLVWTRKYRGHVDPMWISTDRVEAAETRPTAYSRGVRFRYYETTDARIAFVEGEFNWRPRLGDRSTSVSMLADGAMLSYTGSAVEREIELTTYPDQAATLAAFGADPRPRPRRVHPVQPMPDGGTVRFLVTWGLILAVFSLVLGVFMSALVGREVLNTGPIPVARLPAEVTFELTDTRRLTVIEVATDVSNSWAWLELSVTDPEDEPVFEVGREVGFYSGRDNEGSWTEGSRRTTFRFHPAMPGTYTAELSVPESETWQRGGAAIGQVRMSVTEGRSSGFWLFLLGGLFILVGVAAALRRGIRRRARWRGSDWVDEDDDDD